MHPWELVVIAVGLSMDAFAIAVCKGLSVDGLKKKHMVVTGLWFGGAQGLMPLIGYLLGTGFRAWIERLDHWIAFVLLLIIGLGMIKESRQEGRRLDASFAAGAMLYVVVAELIPESRSAGRGELTAAATLAGFALMMALDTAL